MTRPSACDLLTIGHSNLAADRFVAKFHPDQLAQAVMELLPEPVAAPQAATG